MQQEYTSLITTLKKQIIQMLNNINSNHNIAEDSIIIFTSH